jgi:hypothetical protein
MYRPDPETKPETYAVIYVGHADDLTTERFPFNHPRAQCWIKRAGNRWQVYICTYEVPGGLRSHREQIAQELCAIYHPTCNEERYERSWEDHWIGEYTAPTTGPLTTGRNPSDHGPRADQPSRTRTDRSSSTDQSPSTDRSPSTDPPPR